MPTVEKDHQHNEKYGEKMSTAIVRHILVKDLSTAEVLKKQLQAGAEFAIDELVSKFEQLKQSCHVIAL